MLATGKTHKGYKVFDANGLEWTRVTECDTETGRIERRRESDAKPETVYAAAPLLLVPIEKAISERQPLVDETTYTGQPPINGSH